ncbi:MAG: secretion protein HlyD [Pedobacter sp.]|nr:MAG: secretion protein HlyD [Pedobacter sp.]
MKLLVEEQVEVKMGQPLAFIESTGRHLDVMLLVDRLNELRLHVESGQPLVKNLSAGNDLMLGELQASYQSFYQSYLQYLNTQLGGLYAAQKNYLELDLLEIKKLEAQLYEQKKIQEQEFANVEEEYQAYRKLRSKNVISNNEFKQQENKYLSSKYPLQQNAIALLNNNSSLLAKQKEVATLNNTIREEQARFIQALNAMQTETSAWIKKYVVLAPLAGKVGYAGIIQESQNVFENQQLFIVNPGSVNFFGEVHIPQYNMGKIKLGQRTLVKLRSFPFEEYGIIDGKISYISDVAFRDSVFVAKIDFLKIEQKNIENPIVLKQGMVADAEIITQKSSLLQRFLQSISKMLNSK